MANSKQAEKRARQAEKRRQENMGQRSHLRTRIKKVVYALLQKEPLKAEEEYKRAVPIIDKMVSKGIIHKNKAARHKSRLSRRIKTMKAEVAA